MSWPQAEAEGGRLRRSPSAGPQALRAVAEEGLCEAGLAAAPATVLLAAAPGCAQPLNPRSLSYKCATTPCVQLLGA